MANKLPKWSIELLKDRLVEEKLAARFDDIAFRPEITSIRWLHASSPGEWLSTPYGDLNVIHIFGGWTVSRDDDPLIHARSSKAVIFPKQRAAKAAGLIHLQDDFGDLPAWKDGLWWDVQRRAIIRASQAVLPSNADSSVPDNHEWGHCRLVELVEKSSKAACVADQRLLLRTETLNDTWAVSPPTWTRRGPGYFELATPYGTLVVSRMVGWKVELNGLPLVCAVPPREILIFDRLEHARACALRSLRGHRCQADETRWGFGDELPQQARPLQA
jgi:hypothetical protein